MIAHLPPEHTWPMHHLPRFTWPRSLRPHPNVWRVSLTGSSVTLLDELCGVWLERWGHRSFPSDRHFSFRLLISSLLIWSAEFILSSARPLSPSLLRLANKTLTSGWASLVLLAWMSLSTRVKQIRSWLWLLSEQRWWKIGEESEIKSVQRRMMCYFYKNVMLLLHIKLSKC